MIRAIFILSSLDREVIETTFAAIDSTLYSAAPFVFLEDDLRPHLDVMSTFGGPGGQVKAGRPAPYVAT